jgi:F0F1-type ATP synthase membrane subunit b/b'
MSSTAAMVAWLLFCALVLFMELMVVFAKLVFGETVDDRIDRIREQLSRHKAESYLESVTSPLAGARGLLESST